MTDHYYPTPIECYALIERVMNNDTLSAVEALRLLLWMHPESNGAAGVRLATQRQWQDVWRAARIAAKVDPK